MTIQRDYAERLLEESLNNEEILKDDASGKTKMVYISTCLFAKKFARVAIKQCLILKGRGCKAPKFPH